MGEPYRYIQNSFNPLQPGEDLYRHCELGLDEEEVHYIRESHGLQIRIGGEAFYLFQRQSGSSVGGEITTWEQPLSNYLGTLWTSVDGEQRHPDIRINQSTFRLYNDGALMNRVFESDFLMTDTDYFIERLTGGSQVNEGKLRIWLNEGVTPGTVTYQAVTMCSCVDVMSGYANRECPICKGTSTPAAFTQYLTAGTKYSPVNTILVRVPMSVETAGVDNIGRVLARTHKHWVLPEPYVYNYDLIRGTTGRNTDVLFEIIEKYDSRVRGILLHQEFTTLRIDMDDIRYSLIPAVV